MRSELYMGDVGVKALVALCSHVIANGNFATSGKTIARIMLHMCQARDEARTWRLSEGHSSKASIKRMEAVLKELNP